jgi:YtkA-like
VKKIAGVFLLIFCLAGVGFAKDYEVTKKVDDLMVIIKIDKNPPVAGENNLTVQIKDGTGKPVADAKVKVDYSMPPMPGMAPMDYKTDAELKGQEYKAKLNFSMGGAWNVVVTITPPSGKAKKVRFNVDAK